MAKEEPGNFVRLSLRYYQKNSQLKTIGADLSDDELEILINELREKSETLLLQKLEAERSGRMRWIAAQSGICHRSEVQTSGRLC